MTTLDKIKAAYAHARTLQPKEYPALPTWEQLPIEMREAFITMWTAGRRDGFKEARR
jgi:hypothetical protein